MFNIPQTASARTLEQLATELLLACGCTPDGRWREDVDPRQTGFDIKVTYYCAGGSVNDLPATAG